MQGEPTVMQFYDYHTPSKIEQLLSHAESEMQRSTSGRANQQAPDSGNEQWVVQFVTAYAHAVAERVVQHAAQQINNTEAEPIKVVEFAKLAAAIIPHNQKLTDGVANLQAKAFTSRAAVTNRGVTAKAVHMDMHPMKALKLLHVVRDRLHDQRSCFTALMLGTIRRALYFQAQQMKKIDDAVFERDQISKTVIHRLLQEHTRRLKYLQSQQKHLARMSEIYNKGMSEAERAMFGMDVEDQGIHDQQQLTNAKSKVAEATVVLNERMLRNAERAAANMVTDIVKACSSEMSTFKLKVTNSCQQPRWKDEFLKVYSDDLFALEDAVFINEFSKLFTETVANAKDAAQALRC
jgi:hypothetical protein